MDWATLLVLSMFAVSGLLLVASFVIGMFEKQPVVQFHADRPTAPPAPYLDAMVRSATRDHGFAWLGAGRHTKFPALAAALLVSPDRSTLAIVTAGRIAKMPTRKTILTSRLRDGALVTVDEAGTAELDPGARRQILMNADFAELWRLHAAAVAERAAEVLPFPDAATWADFDRLAAERAGRMAAAGNARFVDADRSRYSYTLRGAFRASILHGIRQIFSPENYVRQFKMRPGSGKTVAPPTTVATPVPEGSPPQ